MMETSKRISSMVHRRIVANALGYSETAPDPLGRERFPDGQQHLHHSIQTPQNQPGVSNPIHPRLQKVNRNDINLLDSVGPGMQTVRG